MMKTTTISDDGDDDDDDDDDMYKCRCMTGTSLLLTVCARLVQNLVPG